MNYSEFSYIPIRLYPKLNFSWCEVFPGIRLQNLTKELKEAINGIHKNSSFKPSFRPTNTIEINHNKYLYHFEKRLKDEGKKKDKIKEIMSFFYHDKNLTFIPGREIAQHVLMGLALTNPREFHIEGSYSFRLKISNNKKMISGYGHALYEQTPRIIIWNLMKEEKAIKTKGIIQKLFQIEKYYRPNCWLVDRMSVALNCIWSSICTPYMTQAYIGFTIVLEALLSTRTQEIAHTIAERASILLEHDKEKRMDIYKKVKKLYTMRSKIVHGDIKYKKGSINWETLYVDAKKSVVPITGIKKIGNLAIDVINANLNNKELLSIIQSDKNADKIKQDLDDFYLRLLLK